MPRSTLDSPAVAGGVDPLIRQSGAAEPPFARHPERPSVRRRRPLGGNAAASLVCAALLAVALSAALLIESFFVTPSIVLVFLPVVLFAAVRYGFMAALASSAAGIAATSYVLTEPRFTQLLPDAGSVWAFAVFVIVSALTSRLATQSRERAAAARRHSRVIEELYAFSSKLASISVVDEIAAEAVHHISSMLHAHTVLLLPENGALRAAAAGSHAELEQREMLAAEWCWENGQPAGRGAGVFHGVSHLYLRLNTSRGPVGVLGIRRDGAGPLLGPEESRLLDALADQVAVSLERARLAEEMHEAEVLAATERLRTALLTSISHDLKTPLSSILGNVTSLREYGHLYDEATRLEMLTHAESETVRLTRFVENLLHMTRIDAGALRPTFEPADPADLIGAALLRCEKRLHGHRVTTDVAPDLPMVPIDFVLAEHVIVNLLDNAAKYAPTGSSIRVTVTQSGEDVRISVEDEGPGIAAGDLQRVFERFFRASAADHRRAGTGLGLAICKGFVEAMGGRIAAANRKDRSGAVFTFTLPIHREHAAV